jgi:hypothetical protein
MKLIHYTSKSGIRYIGTRPKVIAFTTCLSLLTSFGNAQPNSAGFDPNLCRSISVSSFDSLVSRSIVLLKTMDLSQICDSDQIAIMRCLNTIIFIIKKPAFEKRFNDDKYQSLVRISEEKDYSRNIIKVYPKWIPNRGMGFYFPKLKMEVYGMPMPYAMFNVRYFEAGPVKLIDSSSGDILVLDANHITIGAFSKTGTPLWKTDPRINGEIAPYRIANPVIVYFALGWTHECSWCRIPGDAKVLWIEYDNSQIGFLDLKSGKFRFCGQS